MFRRKHWGIHNLYCTNRKKGTKIDKNGEEVTKNITYILQFIDSTRLIWSSLSSFINKLSLGIHKIKCKYGQVDKNCENCKIKYSASFTCFIIVSYLSICKS